MNTETCSTGSLSLQRREILKTKAGVIKLADNAKIKLILKQTADGSTDSSELFTRGEFREHGGSFFIDYDESEATGYAGSHVQLRIGQQDDTVTMTRTGKAFSSLVFENGKRHFCQYGTEYGDCMIGISTVDMRNGMTSDGGELYVRYTIDVNAGLMLENEITIHVKPHNN
ncbi:MAG TPA: DUF1934 domain-containing protein [Ruminococcaceae bacterium]|nr:DUF1934 domain-containing protein [Oscillospiraceae bacterium]HCK50697.1 DUF1934 domain-containing protein [Oscillospiraceae bacterium]